MGKKVPFALADHDEYDRLKTSADDTEYVLASQYLTETTIIFHVAHGLPKVMHNYESLSL